MSVLETLGQVDRELFIFLNSLNHPLLDEAMYWISSKVFWIPFYLLLAWVLYRRLGAKGFGLLLVMVALLILLCDQTASGLLKPWIARFRPCQPEAGIAGVHVVHGHCGGLYGFVSSHAANFFGLATFLSLYFKHIRLTLLFVGLASLTAYSRIYLGVHYPGDILGGAMIGAGWGYAVSSLYVYLQKNLLQKQV